MSTTKKATPRKKPVAKKKTPEIISYAIKMVIPTVAYGNIQPEIVVKANSLEEAHDFIVPHLNKLWKEYFLVDGKRPVQKEPVKPAPIKTEPTNPNLTVTTRVVEDQTETTTSTGTTTPTPPPSSTVAFVKASQAIDSCLSLDALDLIRMRVDASVKLTAEDKELLKPLLSDKSKELNGK